MINYGDAFLDFFFWIFFLSWWNDFLTMTWILWRGLLLEYLDFSDGDPFLFLLLLFPALDYFTNRDSFFW